MKDLLGKIWLGQLGLLLIGLALGLSTVSIFFQNIAQSRSLLLTQTRNQELLLARAGSQVIEGFFRTAEDELILLSNLPDIASANSTPKPTTNAKILTLLNNPVSQIAKFDQNGRLIFLIDRTGPPASLSGTIIPDAIFTWSKLSTNRDEIFISTPYISGVGSVAQKYAVALATPLYQDSLYTGTLGLVISIDDFDTAFISPLGKNADEEVFTLGLDGTVVDGPLALERLNLFYYAQSANWPRAREFSKTLRQALSKTESTATWTFLPPGSASAQMQLAAVRLIDVPRTDNNLYIVITYPTKNLNLTLAPLYSFGNNWLRAGVYTTFIAGLIITAVKFVLTKIIQRQTKDRGITL